MVAPHEGQVAWYPLTRRTRSRTASREPPHGDLARAERRAQPVPPGPVLARPAAVQVEGGEAALGEGVAGQVGLGQEEQAGDPALPREDAPERLARRAQAQLLHDLAEERFEDVPRAE